MTDERTRRIGHNEALARVVNERLEDLNETFSTVTGHFDIVCECGDSECSELIPLTPAEYERLRADATTFAVVAGHDAPDVEDVVEHRARYDVVRKHAGAPQRIAEATEPRT